MHAQLTEGAITLVWIDSEEAIIVRWNDRATVERVRSGVEGRHRATGSGSGRVSGDTLERARREHLRSFVAEVTTHVPPADDVAVVGPGVVRERLERELRADDRRHGRTRHVHSSAAERLTEQELVARVRLLAGDAPPRGAPGD